MGHELQYETYTCGMYSSDVDEALRDNEEYKRKVEAEIFSLICMDPAKVRNNRRRKKEDCGDDTEWLNNAQYLTRLWEELKEQWDEANWKIMRCSDIKSAMDRKTRKVLLCPDCKRELRYEKIKPEKEDDFWREELMCPVCKKIFSDGDPSEEKKAEPMEAEIDTWSEG